MRIALAVSAAAIALASCGGDHPTATDASTGLPGETIYDSPQGFGDVLTFCDGKNRVYVSKDDVEATSAIYVLPGDLRCK